MRYIVATLQCNCLYSPSPPSAINVCISSPFLYSLPSLQSLRPRGAKSPLLGNRSLENGFPNSFLLSAVYVPNTMYRHIPWSGDFPPLERWCRQLLQPRLELQASLRTRLPNTRPVAISPCISASAHLCPRMHFHILVVHQPRALHQSSGSALHAIFSEI